MHKVIILDEFDIYKAQNDKKSREALESADLEPVEIQSEKFQTITKYNDDRYSSGTILVASPYKSNIFYPAIGLEEKLRHEYFQLLYIYAPIFGVSEIKISYFESNNDAKKSQKQTLLDSTISSNGIGAVEAKFSADEFEKNTSTDKLLTYDERHFNDLRLPLKHALEKLVNDGINYQQHNILHEIVQLNGGQKSIKCEIDFTNQSTSINKIKNDISAIVDSKIKIPIKIKADFKEEKNSEKDLLHTHKLRIDIIFHEDNSIIKKSKKFLFF
ncbi:MAG: hypothetical protein KU37_10825 [Sulfuricurvum sp. PC08-66]|nr:MAG: hypothetical protein KU37_10825 [Sulfuricurvum sp. PC08-66]